MSEAHNHPCPKCGEHWVCGSNAVNMKAGETWRCINCGASDYTKENEEVGLLVPGHVAEWLKNLPNGIWRGTTRRAVVRDGRIVIESIEENEDA